jgi:hypothetical protein
MPCNSKHSTDCATSKRRVQVEYRTADHSWMQALPRWLKLLIVRKWSGIVVEAKNAPVISYQYKVEPMLKTKSLQAANCSHNSKLSSYVDTQGSFTKFPAA